MTYTYGTSAQLTSERLGTLFVERHVWGENSARDLLEQAEAVDHGRLIDEALRDSGYAQADEQAQDDVTWERVDVETMRRLALAALPAVLDEARRQAEEIDRAFDAGMELIEEIEHPEDRLIRVSTDAYLQAMGDLEGIVVGEADRLERLGHVGMSALHGLACAARIARIALAAKLRADDRVASLLAIGREMGHLAELTARALAEARPDSGDDRALAAAQGVINSRTIRLEDYMRATDPEQPLMARPRTAYDPDDVDAIDAPL